MEQYVYQCQANNHILKMCLSMSVHYYTIKYNGNCQYLLDITLSYSGFQAIVCTTFLALA